MSDGTPAGPSSDALSVVLVDDQDLAVDAVRLKEVARRTAAAEGAVGEISLLLVDAEHMAELHVEHMGEEGPTDVLSFPVDGLVTEPSPPGSPPVLVGEVVVCPSVARDQAPGGPEALAGELDLLVAHGVLHILGHDHDTEEGAERMRARELRHAGRSGAQA
ncbi:MAG: rRNA maturation RNase YbeY [Actinomycetota bacterium]